MTTLGDIAALAGRRITAMWRSPAKVIGVLMMPISMVLVLGYLFDGSIALPGGQRYVDYLTAGVAVQVGLACVATSALGIADDLRGGLADRFRSLPIRRSAVLFGHTISELSLVAVGIAATSGIAALLGWRIHATPLSAIAGFALLLLFSYGMLWVGVLIGLSIRGTEAISSTAAMIMVLGSFVSNAFVPLRGLPDWLATVSAWNPVSSVVAACRALWGNPTVITGTGFAEQHATVIAVGVLALVLLVTVTASSRVYRRAVAG